MTRFKHDKGGPYPLTVELKAGKYKWCACGRTGKPPFCDGTCKGGKPLKFAVEKKSTVRLCNCGLTSTPPFCDGEAHEAMASPTTVKKKSKKSKKK